MDGRIDGRTDKRRTDVGRTSDVHRTDVRRTDRQKGGRTDGRLDDVKLPLYSWPGDVEAAHYHFTVCAWQCQIDPVFQYKASLIVKGFLLLSGFRNGNRRKMWKWEKYDQISKQKTTINKAVCTTASVAWGGQGQWCKLYLLFDLITPKRKT